MKQTAKNLRKKLLSQVRKMGKNPQIYASRPGRDFTRRRALDFENIIFFLLTMSCESVGKNLMKAFRFQEKTPSASAFVQQRKSFCLGSVYSSQARMAAQMAIQRTCTAAIKASEVLA